jgi:hypothetical protein
MGREKLRPRRIERVICGLCAARSDIVKGRSQAFRGLRLLTRFSSAFDTIRLDPLPDQEMSMSIATKTLTFETGRGSGGEHLAPRALVRKTLAFILGRPVRPIPTRIRRGFFRTVLFLVGGLMTLIAFALSARAGTHVLVVPLDDGYGLSDCLTENASCGPIVASAWCKAQGRGGTGSLGPAGTKATAADAPQPGPRSLAITCQE